MITSRTPMRVSLMGGGLDYPEHWQENGGLVVGMAIRQYSYISLRRLPPFHSFRHRMVYSQLEECHDLASVRHRAIRACFEYAKVKDDDGGPPSSSGGGGGGGYELFHSGDLPGRCGLGTSSSFVVGLLNSLSGLSGHKWPQEELADGAMEVEQKLLGENVGCQDQIFAAYGGFNVVRFFRSGAYSVEKVCLSQKDADSLLSHLMLVYTGIQRDSTAVVAGYKKDKTREMYAMSRMTEEAVDAVHACRRQKLGELMDRSWQIKCSLSDKVAPPEVQAAYASARLEGAWGGKLTGAGGGGCLLLVCPPERQASALSSLSRHLPMAVPVPLAIDDAGSVIVYHSRG